MAHVAKYKATSVGHMLAHYRRDQSSLERDNIDRGRVDLNYDVKIGSDGRASRGSGPPDPHGPRSRSAARLLTVPPRPRGGGPRGRTRC